MSHPRNRQRARRDTGRRRRRFAAAVFDNAASLRQHSGHCVAIEIAECQAAEHDLAVRLNHDVLGDIRKAEEIERQLAVLVEARVEIAVAIVTSDREVRVELLAADTGGDDLAVRLQRDT